MVREVRGLFTGTGLVKYKVLTSTSFHLIMAALDGRLDGPMLDLINATSGSIGAFISTSIVFPLDKFKARLQVGESLTDLLSEVTSDGISKLWDGAQSRVLESTCSKFTYFYFYSLLKSFIHDSKRVRVSILWSVQ